MPKVALSSARAKLTQFQIFAPQAKKVSVVGSFNNWDPKKVSAKKDTKGKDHFLPCRHCLKAHSAKAKKKIIY